MTAGIESVAGILYLEISLSWNLTPSNISDHRRSHLVVGHNTCLSIGPDRIILGEFVKAEILDVAELPTEYEEMPIDDE
jgi:hypothetical protein